MFGFRCTPKKIVKCYDDIYSALRRGDHEEVKKVAHSLSYSDGHTLLRFAVRLNNADITRALLKLELKVNIENIKLSNTPLHSAVSNNNLAIVEMLLEHRALVNVKTQCGQTALHIAVANANEKITMFLLNNNAHIDESNSEGMSALCIAVDKNYLQIANILLAYRANVNFRETDEFKWTPLFIAVVKGHQNVVKLLLNHGANLNTPNLLHFSPVLVATLMGRRKILDLLLKYGSEVDTLSVTKSTILYIAVDQGKVKMVQCILKYRPNIENKSNKSALNVAILSVGRKYKKIVELLIEYGLTINKEAGIEIKKRLLYVSIQKGYVKVVKELLKCHASRELSMFYNSSRNNQMLDTTNMKEGLDAKEFKVNLIDFSPLHCAVRCRDVEMIEVLLEGGFPINVGDEDGVTPLHIAVEDGNVDLVQCLIENGANVNIASNNFFTPLFIAAEAEYTEIVKMLLSNGASNSVACNLTPLYVATFKEHKKLRKFALDPKCRDCTTLHFGAEKDSTEFTQLLSDAKSSSSIDIPGNEKSVKLFVYHSGEVLPYIRSILTPLYIAAVKGYTEIVNLILDYESTSKSAKIPIYLVFNDGNDVVQTLLDERVDVTKPYSFTELVVTNECCPITCSHLVERGSNIFIQNKKDGQTKLYVPTQCSLLVIDHVINYPIFDSLLSRYDLSQDIVKCLLCGLEINSKDTIISNNFRRILSNYFSVGKQHNKIHDLHVAVLHSSKTVELLLKCGAKFNFRSDIDRQLLHFTAERGYAGIVDILLKLGADINCRDINGRTAFQAALRNGHSKVVQCILAYDSEITHQMECDLLSDCNVRRSITSHCGLIRNETYLVLEGHLVKKYALDLYVHHKHGIKLYIVEDYYEDINNCKKELKIMESTRFQNHISFYDILTKSGNYIARYLSSESIAEALKSSDYKRQFSLYASMLGCQLRKGIERIKLFEEAKNTPLFKKSKLHCVEEVFFYLSNRDLFNFLLACQLPTVCPNRIITDAAIV